MSERRRSRNLLRGLARLALLRADGLAEFGDTPKDFLNSLAPLMGFALVATFLRIVAGDVVSALTELMITVVALLTPAVLSHLLARRWGCEAQWLRYATAIVWTNWLVLLGFVVVLGLGAGVLSAIGIPAETALIMAELAWAVYGLSLHWMLARRGLGIGRLRTFLLMMFVELGTGLVVVGPLVLLAQGSPD